MTECIITSSLLITVIIALRFLFRGRISRRLQYALWGLVLLRLLIPFSFLESPLSIMNAIPRNLPISEQPVRETSEVAVNISAIPDHFLTSENASSSHFTQVPSNKPILSLVWLFGCIVVGSWMLIVNISFYRRLHQTRQIYEAANCKLRVYVSEQITSPCLFGILHPAVYLTPKAAKCKDQTQHILAHELCHYRHGDHIWLLLRNICLVVYWFNPLVWAASVLSRTDSELACDEAVIKQIGEENRLAYGHTLLDMIAVNKGPSHMIYAATSMVSEKRSIHERLNMIIKNPKTVIPALIAVLFAVIISVGCTFTGAKTASLSAENALVDLASSTFHTKYEVSFQIPEQYEPAADWNIHIAGRLESDDFSQSVHFFDDVNEERAWKPGERYSIALDDGYTELTLTAYLPDGKGDFLEKKIDLLNTPVHTTSYGLMRMQYGKTTSALSPLSGEEAALAQDLIMNYLVASAAWPGVDVSTRNECILLRTIDLDGTTTDYYAYLLDGNAVMQVGTDGSYSRVDDILFEKLLKLAQRTEIADESNPITESDTRDLNFCLSDAIISSNMNPNHKSGFATEAHTILKTVEDGNMTTVYAMALYLEFDAANGVLSEAGGSHMPVAITFEKSATGEYRLKEYWIPKDGSHYGPSIKEKFPFDIYKNAIDTQKYILAETQVCYAKAVEYYHISTDTILTTLLKTISSSPAEASNLKAYLERHPIEYRALLYYGDYTLRYTYREFLKGGQTDLSAQILLTAMRELLGNEDTKLTQTATAQEYFEEWKAHAENLCSKTSMEYMEKNYPKTAIMLHLSGHS